MYGKPAHDYLRVARPGQAGRMDQQEQQSVEAVTAPKVIVDTVVPVVEEPSAKQMKFVINSLPKFMPANRLRKMVADGLKISADLVSCKKAPKWDYAFLSLRSTDDREDLLNKLNGLTVSNQQLKVRIDDGTVQSLSKSGKLMKREPNANDRCLNDQVTPLWKMAYEDQLKMKEAAMEEIVEGVEVKKDGFKLEAIKASPVTHNYRNKCEFSFGYDKDHQPTLGFSLGGFVEGTVMVANARDCVHVPDAMKALADAVQAHVASRGGEAPVFDRKDRSGFWRLMMVRLHGGKLMVVLQCQQDALAEEKAEKEVGLMVEMLKGFEHSDIAIGSLWLQMTAAVHHGMDPKASNRLLFGAEKLVEELDGLKYEISLGSFFQVNKPATLVLYDTIREYVVEGGLGKEMVLLDLCCGTGTIGMMMAPHVGKVIGVELVPEAVEDARRNAHINGIENIEFHCGKVEDALTQIISSLPPSTPLAVILDPPRSGTHKSVIRTIRNTPRIRSLVFVSCNPKACLQNYADLGKGVSRATGGAPFALSRAVPVDMFPMTEHCELILKFDRQK